MVAEEEEESGVEDEDEDEEKDGEFKADEVGENFIGVDVRVLIH